MSQTNVRSPVAAHTITILGNKSPNVLTIPGRLPNMNDYTSACRSGFAKGNKMKQDAQETVMWQILAKMRRVRFDKPVFLLYTFYEPDRRRDKDNVASFARKVIQDALVKCGTIEDDGWGYITGSMEVFKVDKQNPRIEVQFIETEDTQCKKRQKSKSAK